MRTERLVYTRHRSPHSDARDRRPVTGRSAEARAGPGLGVLPVARQPVPRFARGQPLASLCRNPMFAPMCAYAEGLTRRVCAQAARSVAGCWMGRRPLVVAMGAGGCLLPRAA